MNIKSGLSVLALVSGIAFAGSAFAQTTIGGFDVTDEDLPRVQAQCDALALDDMNGDLAGTQPSDEDTAADADGRTSLEADTSARNDSTSIDLSVITVEDCREAGLIE
jgi:hypothetical protein